MALYFKIALQQRVQCSVKYLKGNIELQKTQYKDSKKKKRRGK